MPGHPFRHVHPTEPPPGHMTADDAAIALEEAGLRVSEIREIQAGRQVRLDDGESVINVYRTGNTQAQGPLADAIREATREASLVDIEATGRVWSPAHPPRP